MRMKMVLPAPKPRGECYEVSVDLVSIDAYRHEYGLQCLRASVYEDPDFVSISTYHRTSLLRILMPHSSL